MRRPTPVVAAAVGAAVLAVLAGGCASSSPTGSRPTTTTTGSGTASTSTSLGATGTRVEATNAGWRLSAGVSRAVVCPDGARLVVLGGLATGDVSTSAVWTVDPAAGTVQRAGSLARAVHDAGGTCTNGGALVFGGGAASTVATVQQWSSTGTRVVGQLPQARSDLAAATLGGRTYVVGG